MTLQNGFRCPDENVGFVKLNGIYRQLTQRIDKQSINNDAWIRFLCEQLNQSLFMKYEYSSTILPK